MKIEPVRSMRPSRLTSPAAIAATDVTVASTIARASVAGIGETSPGPILPKIATSATPQAEGGPRTTRRRSQARPTVLRSCCGSSLTPASGQAIEPEERESAGHHREHRGGERDVRGELRLFVVDDELRGEILVDRAQVLLGARVEVLAIGDLRDLLQGGFIESGANGPTLQSDDRAGRAPDADRVHTDATRGGLIHDVKRRRELIVLAVGRGVPFGFCCCRIELGRSVSVPIDSSMASSETRIARPIAVAR